VVMKSENYVHHIPFCQPVRILFPVKATY
jgi:hypothetical protein